MATPSPAPTTSPDLVEVTLRCAHTHEGVKHAAGSTLLVTPADKELLRHFDVIVEES
ncbi:DUF7210 family protein [Arenimonas oryziterrae]|uniref:DUF7210 family protein n=1 Tax=Arenimonas oryziterrae TaxID=498055 RepID=UPI003CCDDF7E